MIENGVGNMKSHETAKKVWCALLAAGLVSVGGSAFADSVTVASGETKSDTAAISVGTGETFKNEGTVKADTSVTVKDGTFQNTGTLTTKLLDIQGATTDQSEIKGTITATDQFIYRGIGGNLAGRILSAEVTTPVLHIIGSSSQTGFKISDEKVLANVGKVILEAQNEKRTGLVFTGKQHITSEIVLTGSKDARVEVEDGADVTIDTITASCSDKALIQTNNAGKITVNHISVESNALNLQTNGDTSKTGEFTLGNIDVAEDSEFRLCVYNNSEGKASTPNAKITGDININLAKNAVVDFGAMKDGKGDWDGTRMNVAASSITVNVADTSADSNSKVYISANSDVVKTPEKITVQAAGSNNTGDATKDIAAAANVLSVVQDEEKSGTATPEAQTVENIQVVQEASSIYDEAKASVTLTDEGETEVGNVQVTKNPFAYGIADNNALSLMTWRAEMNDMNKRLGELRDSKGENGVWVRMVRGRDSYGTVHNQYNQYQLGYDRKMGDGHWTLGGAITYTDGDTSYGAGKAENTHKGFALYGSRLGDDGTFIDIIAKYARIDQDYYTVYGNGGSSADGYSFSAETGKRFAISHGSWIEPQVELSYGHVTSTNYRLGGIDVAQDAIDSFVGRLGFSLGQDIKRGNVYVRASYLYDFDGDTSSSFEDGGKKRTIKEDLGGGWWEVGFGTNLNLSENAHVYLDMEKTFGGDIRTDWRWNLGMRWSF